MDHQQKLTDTPCLTASGFVLSAGTHGAWNAPLLVAQTPIDEVHVEFVSGGTISGVIPHWTPANGFYFTYESDRSIVGSGTLRISARTSGGGVYASGVADMTVPVWQGGWCTPQTVSAIPVGRVSFSNYVNSDGVSARGEMQSNMAGRPGVYQDLKNSSGNVLAVHLPAITSGALVIEVANDFVRPQFAVAYCRPGNTSDTLRNKALVYLSRCAFSGYHGSDWSAAGSRGVIPNAVVSRNGNTWTISAGFSSGVASGFADILTCSAPSLPLGAAYVRPPVGKWSDGSGGFALTVGDQRYFVPGSGGGVYSLVGSGAAGEVFARTVLYNPQWSGWNNGAEFPEGSETRYLYVSSGAWVTSGGNMGKLPAEPQLIAAAAVPFFPADVPGDVAYDANGFAGHLSLPTSATSDWVNALGVGDNIGGIYAIGHPMCALMRRISASNPVVSGATVNYRFDVSSAIHSRWFQFSSGYSRTDWQFSSSTSHYGSGMEVSSGARVQSGESIFYGSGGYNASGALVCNIPTSTPYWSALTIHGGALLNGVGGYAVSRVDSGVSRVAGYSSSTAQGKYDNSAYVSSRYNDSNTDYHFGRKDPLNVGWTARISGGSVCDPEYFISGGSFTTASGAQYAPYCYAVGNVTLFPGREGNNPQLMLYECGRFACGNVSNPSGRLFRTISGVPLNHSYLGGSSGFNGSMYTSDYGWREGSDHPYRFDSHTAPTQLDWISDTTSNAFWFSVASAPSAAWGSHTNAGSGGTVITFGGYSSPSPMSGATACGGSTVLSRYVGVACEYYEYTSGGSISDPYSSTAVSSGGSTFAEVKQTFDAAGSLIEATFTITYYPYSGGSTEIVNSSSPVSGSMVSGAETWYDSARQYISGAYVSALASASALAAQDETYSVSSGRSSVTRRLGSAGVGFFESAVISTNIISGRFE